MEDANKGGVKRKNADFANDLDLQNFRVNYGDSLGGDGNDEGEDSNNTKGAGDGEITEVAGFKSVAVSGNESNATIGGTSVSGNESRTETDNSNISGKDTNDHTSVSVKGIDDIEEKADSNIYTSINEKTIGDADMNVGGSEQVNGGDRDEENAYQPVSRGDDGENDISVKGDRERLAGNGERSDDAEGRLDVKALNEQGNSNKAPQGAGNGLVGQNSMPNIPSNAGMAGEFVQGVQAGNGGGVGIDAERQGVGDVVSPALNGGENDGVQRSAIEINEKQSISKAEAEMLLRDVRRQTDAKMVKAGIRKKKILVVVILAVILMAVLGVGVWLMRDMIPGLNGGGNGSSSVNGNDNSLDTSISGNDKDNDIGINDSGVDTKQALALSMAVDKIEDVVRQKQEDDVRAVVGAMQTILDEYFVADGVKLFEFAENKLPILYYRQEGTVLFEVSEAVGVIGQEIEGANVGESPDDVISTLLRDDRFMVMIDEFFMERGFARSEDGYQYLNNETGVFCGLVTFGYSADSSSIDFSCGHMGWVSEKQIEEAQELANELTAVYESATGVTACVSALGKIENSSVTPYQRIAVSVDGCEEGSVGGATALFYRVNPDEPWQFFRATQIELLCSDYDADEIRKAFAGAKCYVDGWVEGIVEP